MYNLRMPEREIIFCVSEASECGYEAHALGHAIFTQADSLEELKANVQDAVRCHFGERSEPRIIRLVQAGKKRVLGSAKGEFTVPDDFNESDPEIEKLFYEGDLSWKDPLG